MKYYLINVNNQEVGPYNDQEVIDLIKRGYVPPISRCKVVGTAEWLSIKEIQEFELCFAQLENSLSDNTIIGRLRDVENSEENGQEGKTQETNKKTDKSESVTKTLEAVKQRLQNENKSEFRPVIAHKEYQQIDDQIIPSSPSSDKTLLVSSSAYAPSLLGEINKKTEDEWRASELQKKNEGKTKKKKQQGSIAIIILVLLAVFIFLPDEDEKINEHDQQKNSLNYVIPKFDFPAPYDESDSELSMELLADARSHLKNYSFEELNVAAPLAKSSYENDDKNKKALHTLTLIYSLMIEHAEDKATAANTVFKLLQLIGDGQELKDLDVLTAKCYFLLHLGKFRAVKLLMDKYRSINKNVTALLFSAYIKSLVNSGDLIGAKKILGQLVILKNKNPYVYSAILDFYRVNSEGIKYWETFNEALTVHQKSVAILLQGAYFYIKSQDIKKTEEILKRVKVLEFGKSRHHYAVYLSYLGELMAMKKNPSAAAEILKESLALEENVDLRIRLAGLKANASDAKINALIKESKSINYIKKSQTYLEKAEWDIALTNAIKATEVHKNYYPAELNLARVQSRLGYFDLAIKNLEKFRKQDPNNLNLMIELLNIYTDSYKLDQAGELVGILSQTEMVNSEYFASIMADYYEKKGEPLKSVLWLQQAIKINPLGDINLHELSKHYVRNGHFDLAKNLLNLAMTIDPANTTYRSLYADILYETGGAETAAGYLRQILKDLPDDPVILNKIAILYYRSGQIKDYDDLIKQLKRLPDGANDLNLYLMQANQREGRWSEFITYTNEYLKNDPGDLNIRIALVEAYYINNNYPVAREHLNLAKQRMPTYPKINYYEAKILLAEGKNDEALASAKLEVSSNPNLEMSHVLLGDLYTLKEEFSEAEKCYKAAQRINQRSIDALKGLASIKVRRNEYPVAIELYNRALLWKPDDASLHLILADLYRKMGQTQDAVREYKNFLEIEPESSDRKKIEEFLRSVQ